MSFGSLSLSLALIISANLAPDISTVDADLIVPALSTLADRIDPSPGQRFRETFPAYKETEVYHVTYLPTNWQKGKRYPVVVEFAGNGNYRNKFGDVSTGLVEHSRLGFGMSAGRDFIWVCLPYLNHGANQNATVWWGDAPTHNAQPTVDYCKKVVPWICEQYGGDHARVVLAGFSRGAIACNFIGLHDDAIAKLWCAFVPYSHYDGVVAWNYLGSDPKSALGRLKRLAGRPQFICAEGGVGKHAIVETKNYLESSGEKAPFVFRETGFRNHNDKWILRPSESRTELRTWLKRVVD